MKSKTTIIVGAGASKEVGLPTGFELKEIIAEMLDYEYKIDSQRVKGDEKIESVFRHLIQAELLKHSTLSNRSFLAIAHHIRDALPQASSIDTLIDSQRQDDRFKLVGKLAIVRSILNAEQKSDLFIDSITGAYQIDFRSIGKTWYIPFQQILIDGCSIDQLPERLSNVTMIIFNYDRCIEHFLFYALINYYGISEERAAEILSNITFYHPYGVVGSLPWQKGEIAADFGCEPNGQLILELSKKIMTFTEVIDPETSDIEQIQRRLYESERIIFIGFAFNEQNMKLLQDKLKKPVRGKKCFASTYGISSADEESVANMISGLLNNPTNTKIRLANKTCYEFFKDFRLSLLS